ncbi:MULTISPECIES: anthranilate phosphoribosyltransferase [Thalassospira]|mgnify:FL=1|jgi:anthranilate phosphoribosyltransferase|uniref:Anthranilate phosphoribosyltransferase n=2 Tax=Thalassospira xiamenensis TaxID=220697 RepID=A0ABR5Y4S7_9PROT|nr:MULTISPECIES: anthranilate phosphoribosyltransferase [Thalassospira]MBL4840241.1 anthranilate phosphoribosyltransferase [Thalassospira sp.]MBR9781000.1 anthranilate phosphoribosyltransferase [Rhodospirillales bacterium]KZD05044.1 anthranilate phosphoribosyltransferase [Thalassospira xiamenensis]KZD11738.1 anthranilate phosphoribosyltransferase [Thalassospira xiamenensis]MBR9815791.1 anthranilate phosphoribosyltransferase [Rhodospirillales bacterium]|tara:strand:- start:1130 stop:2164 length:1035 start_codon:yes stop_codon:yes gene_type:complete
MSTEYDLKPILAKVANGEKLNEEQAEQAFDVLMSGQATPSQMGAFLMALRLRGETVDEITGAARVMRSKATGIIAPPNAVDTCGTGGDGSGTFNISTGAAIVAAACGAIVAKHGNRAASSKSGSADVLMALGVNLDADMALLEKALKEINLCFMMATRHHSAVRHVMPTRVEMGTRTIFNLLGPLANPAKTKRQVMGVFAREWVEPIAHVLNRLGSEHAWVVYGHSGLDEISTTGPTFVAEVKNGTVTTFEINPEDYGLEIVTLDALKGGDAQTNAQAILDLLAGKKSAYRDIVLLNAAAALVVTDIATDLADGIAKARTAIDSGKAAETLQALVRISNQGTAA